jgi:hypothetical protein
MTEMNSDTRVYQDAGVYTTPDSQLVHILYGGKGSPDGPGHGHYIYNINQDTIHHHRNPTQ